MAGDSDSNDGEMYLRKGGSTSKSEVKAAIAALDPGLYPTAFCKVLPDISGDPDYATIIHSDSAGTKASLAYMYFKETGDISVFRGIVRDAIVMNVDDLACVGAVGNLILNDTLNRNKFLISGEVLKVIIDEFDKFTALLTSLGVGVTFGGGETADVGDLVRTLDVICTISTRMPRKAIIPNASIAPGDLIVGLASSGQATFESEYNSGIGSNGLTLARHGTLHSDYRHKYPETYDPALNAEAYGGKYHLTDRDSQLPYDIGKALLSPTRSFSPVIRELLQQHQDEIHGLIHCTGGGLTKCLNTGKGIHYVKDHLFPAPRIFQLIQQSAGVKTREMFQAFNMGHRMEVVCPQSVTGAIIAAAQKFRIDARVIGKCEKSPDSANHVTILANGQAYTYP